MSSQQHLGSLHSFVFRDDPGSASRQPRHGSPWSMVEQGVASPLEAVGPMCVEAEIAKNILIAPLPNSPKWFEMQ